MAKHGNDTLPSEEDYRAQGDMRTLIDAERIKGDKPRLRKAMALAKKERKAIANVVGSDNKGKDT